ncbi:MAG: diacylglycerol kinase family lipid kinase [Chloroflexi bacterium]|nr:diacylglycerol kinase family lipid kinase [Chloroflexota bacterium]
MRTVLIFNPISGVSTMATNHSSAEENKAAILAALNSYGIEPEVWYTTEQDPGSEMARRAAQEGVDIVIAAGGDGTLHAVASGLIGTNSALGIIPSGTMNNVAHSLKISENIAKACEIIAKGTTSLIDVGKINNQIFLEVAGVGLEAALFPAAEEIKSAGWLSTVRGVIDGLSALFAFQPTRFSLSFDGHRTRRYSAIQISICNSPYYGAHLQFAPSAVMNDGLLDVLIYKNFSKLEYLRHAISISQGRRALEPRVTRRKIKSLHIYADHPVEIHADGVPKGHTPATITVVPGVLRVRVPEKIAAGPNIASPSLKQTRHYKRAKSNELLEEKGPLHVK